MISFIKEEKKRVYSVEKIKEYKLIPEDGIKKLEEAGASHALVTFLPHNQGLSVKPIITG